MDTHEDNTEVVLQAMGFSSFDEFILAVVRDIANTPKEELMPYQIIIDLQNPDNTIWLFGQEEIDAYAEAVKKGFDPTKCSCTKL